MTAFKSGGLVLKEEQKAALYAVTLKKQDCLCISPTGFGKSLILFYYYIYLFYFILFIIIIFTYIILFYLRTRLLARGMRAGSKMECVVLCDFYFCCAFIFGQPMKKFEFFGASRATRRRHFKPEDEWLWGREWCERGQTITRSYSIQNVARKI